MAVSRAIILLLAAGFAGGAAFAQAPIIYKSTKAGGMTAVRLDNRVDAVNLPAAVAADPMSLNVAPHAPIPTFVASTAKPTSFGPAPLAATRTEPQHLQSAPAIRQTPQVAVPFAGPAYQVDGRWYVPAHEPNYDEVGIASWYGPTFHGKASASGETFDENDLTAAHPTLPIPSLVRVTNLENGKSVVVRLNDRGPFVDDRIIDMSKAAAAALDMHKKGTAKVRVQYVGPAPAQGGGVPGTAAQPQPIDVAQRIDVGMKPLPPVMAPPAPAKAGGFYLQVGSFSDLINAQTLRNKLAGNGPVAIELATVNGADVYRVLVGPWDQRDAADSARARLASGGVNGLVVARGR